MNPILLAIISSIILSLNQVLIKLFINKYNLFKLTNLTNLKFLSFGFFIIFVFFIGVFIWLVALKNTEITNIYGITAIYYIAVPLFSYLIIKENISGTQIIGYFVITLGAFIASAK